MRQQPVEIADRARVVDYMRAVTPAFDVLDVTVDLVDGTTKIRSGSSLVTDGVWVWRTDSIRHLGAHGLPIDPDFLEHARARDYRAPEDVEVTDELEDALLRYYRAHRGTITGGALPNARACSPCPAHRVRQEATVDPGNGAPGACRRRERRRSPGGAPHARWSGTLVRLAAVVPARAG